MSLAISYLTPDPNWFPNPAQALEDPNGLLAVGGDLTPKRLVSAYCQGIFPWFSEEDPILWWSPDPRSVLIPKTYKTSRSLQKFMRKQEHEVTIDQCFEQVMINCATTREETWINDAMLHAYCTLHELGIAHSVEYWQGKQLMGGLYGLSIGGAFFGESMFSKCSNASKVAFTRLCQLCNELGIELIDCQVHNPHLASLGAIEINRKDFLAKISKLINKPVKWQPEIMAEHE
ncbi:leucyl/phenylalanyl-tRNA--protein transferase [Bermanella marisrubri]|uniref:Leucyl/phenylalanyl-tRNA--protein transferase n=1 Tax=Bermanella marisrubri TaxID=207949 RepID=Q1N4M7_9GAMM|nr:leucyl/phenylalanyl-tRNA--protein transferase [Bermanella marisrubri]EAT13401.1 leucyl/phenylalanyl-tRNA--protein transferase [Oceanobacter sp. RED65] [Bermanella marisrubri]QIZ84152.1 leucyl/phenylalanyl-tRNA--protein transferase [Bermanella marisrubri]